MKHCKHISWQCVPLIAMSAKEPGNLNPWPGPNATDLRGPGFQNAHGCTEVLEGTFQLLTIIFNYREFLSLVMVSVNYWNFTKILFSRLSVIRIKLLKKRKNEPAKSYVSLEHLYDYSSENTITHNNDCKHSLILFFFYILSFLNLSLIPKGQATKTKNIMPKLSGPRSV